MDRNDSNPGMVERQLDEPAMEGMSASDRELSQDGMGGMERESLQGGSVEREGMQGDSPDRDALRDGDETERESLSGSPSGDEPMTGRESEQRDDSRMRADGREGALDHDRPTDRSVTRETMDGSSRNDQGSDHSLDQPRGTTTARDW